MLFAVALKQNTGLTTLNLNGNQIGPQGAEHLAAALEQNACLRTLNLNSNQIVSILEKLDEKKEVKYLNIQDLNYAGKDVFMIFDKWMRKKLQG